MFRNGFGFYPLVLLTSLLSICFVWWANRTNYDSQFRSINPVHSVPSQVPIHYMIEPTDGVHSHSPPWLVSKPLSFHKGYKLGALTDIRNDQQLMTQFVERLQFSLRIAGKKLFIFYFVLRIIINP